jgi:hypothetical protein
MIHRDIAMAAVVATQALRSETDRFTFVCVTAVNKDYIDVIFNDDKLESR